MPNEVQRLIRKMQPAGPRSFDEHVWPIYVAIVVLFGYLVGVVVSLLNFNDARVHANAFTWLLALTGIGVGGLFLRSILTATSLEAYGRIVSFAEPDR